MLGTKTLHPKLGPQLNKHTQLLSNHNLTVKPMKRQVEMTEATMQYGILAQAAVTIEALTGLMRTARRPLVIVTEGAVIMIWTAIAPCVQDPHPCMPAAGLVIETEGTTATGIENEIKRGTRTGTGRGCGRPIDERVSQIRGTGAGSGITNVIGVRVMEMCGIRAELREAHQIWDGVEMVSAAAVSMTMAGGGTKVMPVLGAAAASGSAATVLLGSLLVRGLLIRLLQTSAISWRSLRA
jgi:hypothetical protein